MMEAIHSSETSVITRVTRRQIQEDGIPQENLNTENNAYYEAHDKASRKYEGLDEPQTI
jgi:hypothetical protein